MRDDKRYVIDNRETPLARITRSVVFFIFLIICIVVSKGSAWWTFFTACLVLLWITGLSLSLAGRRVNTFYSLDELGEWVAIEKKKEEYLSTLRKSAPTTKH